jgi:hypothetical protein
MQSKRMDVLAVSSAHNLVVVCPISIVPPE